MRKQTKIAAIVSAAALLAVGASMTAFAVTGWQEEDGTWVYYDRNGEQVTDKWEKSGDNWFYLDDSGEMATDSLIEDDDNYYYVDANGAMVRNQWIAIDNEDAGDDDQPDVWWYYFQGNGKAYKNNHSSGNIFKKQINGKTYCFNDEGKMQYGWVDKEDGQTRYEDDAYKECDFYFGDENDGAMTVGWREIALTDVDDSEDDQPGDNYWDEDQVRWFWFKSSGKKQTAKDNKTINGRKYGFDEWGRMIADWHSEYATKDDNTGIKDKDGNVLSSNELSRRGYKKASATNAQINDLRDYAKSFQYFSSPESGARYTKGWFKVVPGYYLNKGDNEDSTDRWYYADGNGKLYAGAIKSIKGKKYAFDLKGSMISGLAILRVDKSNNIYEYVDDENHYDTEDAFDTFVGSDDFKKEGYGVYYFSDDADHDGTMKTGTQKVVIDGETFTFKFKKSGTDKGRGITGLDDHKYYLGGKLLSADSDEKIKIINTTTYKTYTVSEFLTQTDAGRSLKQYQLDDKQKIEKASSGDTIYVLDNTDYDKAKASCDLKETLKNYKVVNTSGAVVKNGNKKDGDGIRVVLSGESIKSIYVED
jgi:glucan-binding YG repeat protein